MKTKKTSRHALPVELSWTHCGNLFRISVWPEVSCEKRSGDNWERVELDSSLMASAAVVLDKTAWNAYLEYVPFEERAFIEQFRYGRLAALWVLTKCSGLIAALAEAPALTSFIAAHMELRGTSGPRWSEIAVVYERGGIFGLLEWLGLPASRQTLVVLRNLLDPDIPQRLLEPLRMSLWEPAILTALQKSDRLTDRDLARCCHALAA